MVAAAQGGEKTQGVGQDGHSVIAFLPVLQNTESPKGLLWQPFFCIIISKEKEYANGKRGVKKYGRFRGNIGSLERN